MGRRVKCWATKEYGDSDKFVKFDGKYYKSTEIYHEHLEREKQKELEKQQKKAEAQRIAEVEAQEKQMYLNIIGLIAVDLMDYAPGQPFPKIITKKLKEFNFYDREIIYMTLSEIKHDLKRAMSKNSFKSDTAKAAYIFAALSNNINDVYQREKKRKRDEEETARGTEQLVEMSQTADEIVKPIKQKVKDISSFL